MEPIVCPKCGERQHDTKNWYGEAIKQRARATRMEAALRAVEDATNACVLCYGVDGHASNCLIGKALAEEEA